MREFSGAIFDLDGTLLDSMGVWTQIDIEFLRLHGLEVEQDYVEAITAMGFHQAAEYTKQRYGLTETVEGIVKQWHDMSVTAYRDVVELKPGAGEYLRSLKSKGVKLALATASSKALAEPALRRCGVLSLFDALVTSDAMIRDKSEPDIYLLAAERLDVPPEGCCVFEDILKGIQGAKKAGMQTVGVSDASSVHEEEQIRALADAFISGFHELLHANVQ